MNTTENLLEVERTFSPRVRTLRAKVIATLFQNGVTMLMEQSEEEIQDKLNDPYIGELAEAEYSKKLANLSRVNIIKNTTPKVLLDMVRETLKDQSEMAKEELITYIIEDELTGIPYYDKLTNKQKQTLATKWATERLKELPKVLDNFDALAKDSLLYIQQLENIKIQLEDNYVLDTILEEDISLDGEESVVDPEENTKEGWMNKARNISTESTLSIMVKNKLSNLVLIGQDGELQTDDLGFFMNVGLDYANGILLNNLYKMESIEDLVPMLENLAIYHPWVNQLIKNINYEPELATQLYKVYRKDPITYRIHRSEGTEVKTIDINKGSGVTPLIEDWRENTESGIIFNKELSIYNSIGNVNKKNLEKLQKRLSTIHGKYNTYVSMSKEVRIEKANKAFEDSTNIEEFNYILQALGINMNISDLTKVLQNNSIEEDPAYLQILSVIDKIIMDIEDNIGDDNSILDKAKNNYIKMAGIMSITMTDAIEASIRQGSKTYFSYTKPSYMTSLIKRLNNTKKNSEETYKKWIDENYLNAQYFMSNGNILNNWLKLLYTNEKPNIGKVFKKTSRPRDIFAHRVVLELDDKEYGDWSNLDYTKVMLSEYTSDPNNLVAGYAVPILGDAQSAEFITGYKYDISDPRQKAYLKSALGDVIIQEYSRIKLVQARKKVMEANPDIKPITNFDSNEEFVFFPELNSIVLKDGMSFIEAMGRITINRIDLLHQATEVIMARGFKNELLQYEAMGLFKREYPNNKNSNFINIPNLKSTNRLDAEKFLEGFYWNNKLAQSQIIQLTTTDLAYYSGAVDFQNNYKQLYLPVVKLNTKATILNYNGERVLLGRLIERTIYIKDDINPSAILDEIIEILDKEVISGNILKANRDEIILILNKMDLYNIATYRSLNSYRSLCAMIGEWTKSMEYVYQRLLNGSSIGDFAIICQSLRPYLCTQTIKSSGVKDEYGNPIMIKVPIQNKSAECLLLTIYSFIADRTRTGQKIKAINDFMEKNEIDVIQFESTVKVGRQGVIDLNGVSCYENTKKILEKAIRNSKGDINFDVVHQFSYEDYGIFQPIPKHLLKINQQRKHKFTTVMTF